MDRLRDALLMYLLLALIAYGAVKLANWAAVTDPPVSPLAAIVLAVDPGLYLDASNPANRVLLDALDGPAYLAMAASAFYLYVAAARVLAPRAASAASMSRALRAALAPLWAWVDACGATAGALLRAARPSDSLLVAALAAYVTYLVIRLADVAAIMLGYPDPPLAALRGALYGAAGAVVIPLGTQVALLRAMDSLAFMSMLGAAPLMASIAYRTMFVPCARLWRKL